MNTQEVMKYSKEEKIDIIFSYLFSDVKTLEEEKFWNELSPHEMKKIDEIDQEPVSDFNILRKEVLGK